LNFKKTEQSSELDLEKSEYSIYTPDNNYRVLKFNSHFKEALEQNTILHFMKE
jgi:hypothetical protein